jgi:hypothetical protein
MRGVIGTVRAGNIVIVVDRSASRSVGGPTIEHPPAIAVDVGRFASPGGGPVVPYRAAGSCQVTCADVQA